MDSAVLAVLKRVQMFEGLDDEELVQIGQLCRVGRLQKGQLVFQEDSEGSDIFIVLDGSVEVQVLTYGTDGQSRQSTINTLYSGQSFGEMALLGGGTRSATVVAAAPATLLVVDGPELNTLCDQSPHIGYRIYRNLTHDVVYKMRSSALLLRGTIKWQDNQLSQL